MIIIVISNDRQYNLSSLRTQRNKTHGEWTQKRTHAPWRVGQSRVVWEDESGRPRGGVRDALPQSDYWFLATPRYYSTPAAAMHKIISYLSLCVSWRRTRAHAHTLGTLSPRDGAVFLYTYLRPDFNYLSLSLSRYWLLNYCVCSNEFHRHLQTHYFKQTLFRDSH